MDQSAIKAKVHGLAGAKAAMKRRLPYPITEGWIGDARAATVAGRG